MAPDDLAFCVPSTVEETIGELAEDEDVILMGGGTSVGLLLKNDLIAPRKIVWLTKIPALRRLSASPEGSVVVGATVTLRELAGSEVIRARYPALAYAASRVGNPRVRAVATVGGALTHSDARQDVPPVLYALGATVQVQGPGGDRDLPGAAGAQCPRAAYGRFTPGSHDDYPTVNAAASIARDGDGRIARAALALGGVGSTPLLVPEAAALPGTVPGPAEVAAVAAAAEAAASPFGDQRGSARYKKVMAREWAARVLRACLDEDYPPPPDLVVG